MPRQQHGRISSRVFSDGPLVLNVPKNTFQNLLQLGIQRLPVAKFVPLWFGKEKLEQIDHR